MSIHPNVLLMAVITPEGLSRKTFRAIVGDDEELNIRGVEYTALVMESDYDEGFQISANEGDLVFFDMVTYGFGKCITWVALDEQRYELEKWARAVCREHKATYVINIAANYW